MKSPGPRMGPIGRVTACVVLAALAGFASPPAAAQTIRPEIAAYQKNRVHGRFELVNDGSTPLNVVLEPQSFDITDLGEPVYRPLDPRIHLRLSAMSIRIPAKQTRFVFYEASTDSLPAWFVIPCTFSGLRAQTGLEVRVELPHTVYFVQKEPLKRSDIEISSATFNNADRVVDVEIENHGPRLGRALEAEVTGGGHGERQASFPMAPGGRRRLLIPWNSDQAPNRVVIRFRGFAVEQPLTIGRAHV